MPSAPARSASNALRVVAMALVPWVAFLVPLALAAGIGDYDVAAGEFGGAALFALLVVALPSLLPLGIARAGTVRWAALGAMTAIAGFAGITVALSDDAQAGLIVLLVPVLAVPVSIGVWIARALRRRKNSAV